jgi:hypothetical protein
MRIALALALSALPLFTSCSVETGASPELTQELEAGCGSCMYHLEEAEGCPLAVVLDGKPMLVTGSDFDAMAHGLCLEKARVRIAGESDGTSFAATSVELVE